MIVRWGEGDKAGIVYSNRNRILDQLIDTILNAKILFGIETNAELNRYLKHWETLRRVKIVDPKGIESYEWASTTGEDHFVFATWYFYLATLRSGNGTFFPEPRRSAETKPFIGRDNVVGDLSEMFNSANHFHEGLARHGKFIFSKLRPLGGTLRCIQEGSRKE